MYRFIKNHNKNTLKIRFSATQITMENFDSVLSSNIEKIVSFMGKILQYNF